MALRGDLGDFALADVFRLVTLSGRTGVLRLMREGGSGSVWFRGGDVFFATSDRRGALLGERLVAAGRVTPAQITRALEVMAEEHEGGRRLGEILIDLGMIDAAVLEQFVQEQIQDTIFDLFLWEDGSFEFELLQAPPEGQDIGLSVSVENIIMESARRLTEATSLRKQNPAAGIVYRMAEMPGESGVEITLRPDEWRVIRLTDGTRTVSEIADEAGLPIADVARTLHGLRGAGLLEIAEEERAADPERAAGLAAMAEIASMPQGDGQVKSQTDSTVQATEQPLGQASRECPPAPPANTPAPIPSPAAPTPGPASAEPVAAAATQTPLSTPVPGPVPRSIPAPPPVPTSTTAAPPGPSQVAPAPPTPADVHTPVHAPAPTPAPAAAAVPTQQPPAGAEPVPGVDDNYGAKNLSERYKIDEVVSPGESIWASVGDELTALTGSLSTRKTRAAGFAAPVEVEKSIHRDPRVSRETVETVLEGLERL